MTTALLEDLVARGIRPDRRRLFVVDGAKALRSAIAQVFGAGNEVQRCRNHKLRNVVGRDIFVSVRRVVLWLSDVLAFADSHRTAATAVIYMPVAA